MAFILSVLAIFLLLLGSEIIWRRRALSGEFTRKSIHIIVGSFVAFWPFFLTWQQIRLLSLGFILGVLISKKLNLFQAIHSVQRPTWGEIFFAVAVGLITFITHDKWIYAASLLQMSLADGLAATVGSRFGGHHKYSIYGHTKSLVGTVTFFVVSLLILIIFKGSLTADLNYGVIVIISLMASVVENVGIKGFDNLLVPLLVAFILAKL